MCAWEDENMLNKVILMGRISQDLDLRQTPNGNMVLTFNVAVERNFARQGEARQTDFITCVAWGKTAEFISRYFSKGRMIAVVGNLRTRTYDDKNGTKHYVTEVYVDEASFTGEPKGGSAQQSVGNRYPSASQSVPVNMAPHNPSVAENNYQSGNDSVNIGDLQDFDVFTDDGVPF
jgi:single-strand DNA-binding protein